MAWARSIAAIATAAMERAGLSGYTTRHPAATVQQMVVDSLQRLREMQTASGSQRWVSFAEPTFEASPWDFGIVAKFELEHISGVQMKLRGKWVELRKIAFSEAMDSYQLTAAPTVWCISPGSNDGTSSVRCLILPWDKSTDPVVVAADSTIEIKAIGLETLTVTTSSSVTLEAPGYEWLMLDVACKLVAQNANSTGAMEILAIERQRHEAIMQRSLASETRARSQRPVIRVRY